MTEQNELAVQAMCARITAMGSSLIASGDHDGCHRYLGEMEAKVDGLSSDETARRQFRVAISFQRAILDRLAALQGGRARDDAPLDDNFDEFAGGDWRLDALRSALGEKRVTPAVPAGRTPRVEHVEAEAEERPRDASSSWSAFLRYVDAKGQETERRFTCSSIHGFGAATHVEGFCHERRAYRCFRVDRIIELACVETGEMFEAVPHFELLRTMGALRVEDPILTEVAKLLVFLARCDSQYHPLERAALEQHITSYCVRFNGTDRMIEDALGGCQQLAPDSHDMVRAIRKLAKAPDGPRVSRFVLDCGAAIINADGRHAPEEIDWAVEMSSALKSIADRA